MGLGDFINGVGDGLEDAWDSTKKTVGSAVDGAAHLVGDGLDAVGLHDAAHAVDTFGDSVADSLGAQVGEYGLGESDDPGDLVHGDVQAIGESAGHLQRFHVAFEATGQGLTRLDADHWRGEAGDAFRARFAPHPKLWLTAADACHTAARALVEYGHTVGWAQQQAKQAIDLYKRAKKASEDAREAYNKQVDSYNASVRDYNRRAAAGQPPAQQPTAPGAFTDPGEAVLGQAQEVLRSARAQRDVAAEQAKAALDTATATAPSEPSFLSRMGHDVSDTFQGLEVGELHLAGGLVKGAADIVKFVRGLNPTDPYNLTHPAQYADHVSSTAAGLLHATNHPMELLSAVVGSGWGSDPFEAFGKLTTNVAFGVATGGAGEAGAIAEDVGANVGREVAENAGRDAAETAGREAAEDLRPKPFGDEWLTGARRRPRDLLDDPAQTRWAEDAYADFLKNDRDIEAISSQNGDVLRPDGSHGYTPEEIASIKKHVFDTEHPIEDYETGQVVQRKFDADPEIADAWIRLRSGRAMPEDHILVEHELAELTYLREHPGATYQEAHRVANQTYNWQENVPLDKREDFEGEW
ncbi:putative T7SS-secreted protein [Kitasatospora sp. NPDC050543]|uniref:putative T7SS-secreted protein n=1 Tax=Kitasatospora sp. NPDC050543 TaxID=3364054 RepID=UPI0037B038BE